MELKQLSKMQNKLGLIGAIEACRAGVVNQWASTDYKYTILEMRYGLSICNHFDDTFPDEDIKTIINHCMPDLKEYRTEQNGDIFRVIKKGE